MPVEANKAIARRLFEEFWDRKNLDVADELLAANYIGSSPGPAGFKRSASADFSAFPDLRVSIEDQIAEGDKVVVRWTAYGTHKGSLFGIPATNKPVTLKGISIYRFIDEKIVEQWTNIDSIGMLRQLEILPQLKKQDQP